MRALGYVLHMGLFGLALFGLYAVRGQPGRGGYRARLVGWLRGMAVLALLQVGVAGMLGALSMSGAASPRELEPALLSALLTGSAVGMAWMLRVAALVAVLAGLFCFRRRGTAWLWCTAAGAAVALGSLVWNGHGAMNEGLGGMVHKGADMLHLFAAGAWAGALLGLLLMLCWQPRLLDGAQLQLLRAAIRRFAWVGTIIVASVLATGAINYLMVVGTDLEVLANAGYGRLLLIKLALFALMLLLAACNRYRLGPSLDRACTPQALTAARRALLGSIALETAAMLLVIMLVAWLGTLSPV